MKKRINGSGISSVSAASGSDRTTEVGPPTNVSFRTSRGADSEITRSSSLPASASSTRVRSLTKSRNSNSNSVVRAKSAPLSIKSRKGVNMNMGKRKSTAAELKEEKQRSQDEADDSIYTATAPHVQLLSVTGLGKELNISIVMWAELPCTIKRSDGTEVAVENTWKWRGPKVKFPAKGSNRNPTWRSGRGLNVPPDSMDNAIVSIEMWDEDCNGVIGKTSIEVGTGVCAAVLV